MCVCVCTVFISSPRFVCLSVVPITHSCHGERINDNLLHYTLPRAAAIYVRFQSRRPEHELSKATHTSIVSYVYIYSITYDSVTSTT